MNILVTFIMSCCLLSLSASTLACTNSTCALPDCYCTYHDIPSGLAKTDTPQMVLFTYTGAVTKKIRDIIFDIFSDSLKNPNKCSIGITLFIVSQGSDDCAIYRLYYRGHEIALAGVNKTSWTGTDWESLLSKQLSHLSEFSNVDIGHITGMRAQRLNPGGDQQYRAIQHNVLQYDSSLLAGPQITFDFDHPYLWPFTLHEPLTDLGLSCLNPTCPTSSYPMIWEFPISSLSSTRMGKSRACTYLDDCLTNIRTASDLSNLLKKHFHVSYNGNRAPFQINLQPRSLDIVVIVEGLRDFVRYVLSRTDSWVVTSQEALKWVQRPMSVEDIDPSDLWSCPERGQYFRCDDPVGTEDKPQLSASVRSVLDVDSIVIWQTVVVILVFIVIYRYDGDQSENDGD